ncbi:MAG: PAS domain S-box protein [Actinomycetes bacterium]
MSTPANDPWDLCPDLLAVANQDGFLTAFNSSWSTLLGYSDEELASQPYLERVHPVDVAETVSRLKDLPQPGHKVIDLENRYQHKDGTYRQLVWNSLTADSGDEVLWFVRDVTEQRARESAAEAELEYLRRRDLMLTDVIENNIALIYAKDLEGRYLLYNRAFAKQAQLDARGRSEGLDADEVLIGRDDAWLDPDHVSHYDHRGLLAQRGPFRVEDVIDVPELGQITFDSVLFPLRDSAGTVYGTCGMSLDTTDHTRALESLKIAARALRESELHYRLLAENATDVVWRLDTAFAITWVSPSVEAVLGWRPQQLIGLNTRELGHPEDSDIVDPVGEQLTAGAAVPDIEIRIRAADGHFHWVSMQGRATTDETGSFNGVVVGMRDIHERVLVRQDLNRHEQLLDRAQDALAIEQQRLKLAMQAARLGAWDWNMITGEVVVDERCAEILGLRIEDLSPLTIDAWDGFCLPEDLVHADDLVEKHAQGLLRFYDTELRVAHSDGSWIWVHDRGKIVERDADGRPTRMIGTVEDITEQIAARQSLADSERMYRLLAENASDIVFLADLKMVVQWVSESITKTLGWSPDQFVGNPVSRFVHPDDFPALRQAIADSDPTKALRHDSRWRCTDGSYRWMSGIGRRATEPDGTVLGRVVGLRDVDELTRASMASQEAQFHYQILAENSNDVVVLMDPVGTISWVSPSILKVLGHEPKDLVGTSGTGLLHPDDLTAFLSVRENTSLTDTGVPLTTRVRTASGDYLRMSGISNPAFDTDGVLVGRIGTLRIVPEQR